MSNLSLSNIVNVSVATPQATLANYSVNTLAILTKDTPAQNYGAGGIAGAVTLNAGAIASVALTNGGAGYTTPPPITVTGGGGINAVITAQVSGGAITGFTVVNGGTNYTSSPTIIIGNSYQVYTDPASVLIDFPIVNGVIPETAQMAINIFAQSPNITSGGGVLIVYAMGSADTLSTALTALSNQIYFGGAIWAGYSPNNSEIEAAASLNQAFSPPRLLGVCSNNVNDLNAGNLFAVITGAKQTQSRTFLYTVSAQAARYAMAAYMSRLMSTNFSGTNTTITMNLKQLTNVVADPGISQSVLNLCQSQTAAADVYASIAGLPEVISTGGNDYSDNVYNLGWFVGANMVALFNALAGTPTKVPQTEAGMSTLKSAMTQVAEQAVANGFIAPGTWTGTYTIGNPVQLQQNISTVGYYIYSQPVSAQPQAQRTARIAPLIQEAIKYAGAIQSTSAVIYVNP
jgi:hypothetical protein